MAEGINIKPSRNYGIDLLRMFAMFLVVVLHVLGQGGVLGSAAKSDINYNAAWILEIGAYCAVNCYALISGYVGLNSKFKYTNIIMLWLRVLFYTVGITLVFQFVMPEALEPTPDSTALYLISEKWDRALFPVSEKQYWYFTAYFLCYFFTPILNKAVQTIERKLMKRTIIMLVAIISIPTLYTGVDVFGAVKGYSALWLVILYLVGAYMKKYNSLSHIGKIQAFAGFVSCVAVTWAVKLSVEEFIPQFKRANILISYTSPTIIGTGIFLFVLFKNINPPAFCCKIIGFFAPLAFSVYIIHVHPLFWEHVMKGWFAPIGELSLPLMIIAVIGASLGLYFACSVVDLIRHYLFKLLRLQKLVFTLEMKIADKFNKKEEDAL
ncbi:MAG: acyltransferase [Oscillospiraceae bacterium]|nr:acyltransferase [Oscillospiraceae bacterium]